MILTTRQLLLLFIVSCFVNRSGAQELFLRHFTVDQGLPSNEVYRILEDTSGYIWLTTDRGIVRYDGYAFEEMTVEGAPPVYPWFGIYQDPGTDKIYFIGLKGQVAVYEQNRLYTYPHNDKVALLDAKHKSEVSILAVRNDSLWFCYSDAGNYMITPGGRLIEQQESPGVYFDIAADRAYLLTGGRRDSVLRLPLYIKWEPGSLSVDSASVPIVMRMLHFERANGQMLFCIGNKILFYKDKRKLGEFVFPKNVFSFSVLDENHVLVGFQNGGVSLYAWENQTFTGPLYRFLNGLSVTKIYRDRQDGLWFTTIENGLFYGNPTRAAYSDGPGVIVFIEKKDKKTFIGYQPGIIRVFEKGIQQQEIRIPVAPGEQLIGGAISTSGRITVVASQHTYIIENDGTLRLADFNTSRQADEPDIFALHGMKAPADALSRKEKSRQVSAKRVTSVLKDNKGRLWLGTFDGLLLYEGDSLVNLSQENSLLGDRIVALKMLPGNYIAAATLGSGLILYRDHEIHVLNKENGLPTPIINDMEADGDTLWLGTNKGLSKTVFVGDSFHVWNYGAAYGLPTLDIHMLSVDDEAIYFKWIDRVVTIEKRHLNNLTPSGSTRIIQVNVSGSSEDIEVRGMFRYNQNEVKISYSSINFANGVRQVYRYRLDGFDDKWYISNERQAVFTNLPPGDYSFQVQVADAQGIFLPHTAQYDFEIRPAFWQQWWFPFAMGLLLLLLAFLYYRGRLRAVKDKNQLMLDLADNQQKALVQMINPHFIFNVLNTAQAAILKEDKMNAASIISRFAKLMRLSLELSREPFVFLEQEIELMKRYIDLEMTRTPGKFTYDTKIGSDIDPASVRIPSMLIQPFVENSIKHGIMHLTDRIGHIQLIIEHDGDLLLCTIDDNGIGREQSAAINTSRLRKHHSVGIDITRRRLRLIHLEKDTEYRYLVKDQYDSNGQPSGTTVIFSIPFNQSL